MEPNSDNNNQKRVPSQLRATILSLVARALSERGSDPARVTDDIIGQFELSLPDIMPLPEGAAAHAFEVLKFKAQGQVKYWREKQEDYPSLEDLTDGDGVLTVPEDIGPLLSGREANGRYSEADWWNSTIREVSSAVVRPAVSAEALVEFAKDMIACSREGGSADGAYIEERATELGLLVEESFDPSRHKDPDGYAKEGDPWFVYHGPLRYGAHPRLPVPSGWRLVPEVPTFEMKHEGSKHYHVQPHLIGLYPMAEKTYLEMLAHAPRHPEVATEEATLVRALMERIAAAPSDRMAEIVGELSHRFPMLERVLSDPRRAVNILSAVVEMTGDLDGASEDESGED